MSNLHGGYGDIGVCLSDCGDLGGSGCGLSELFGGGCDPGGSGCGHSCDGGSVPENDVTLPVSV